MISKQALFKLASAVHELDGKVHNSGGLGVDGILCVHNVVTLAREVVEPLADSADECIIYIVDDTRVDA